MRFRVFHRERLPAALVPFCDWWEVNGPFDLTVAPTGGNRNDEQQLDEFAKGRAQLSDGTWVIVSQRDVVTYAQSADDTSHGHAGAGDFYPVRSLFHNGMPRTVYLGNRHTESSDVYAEAIRRFTVMGEIAESLGLEWGGRHPHFDGPHINVRGWRDLPRVT